MQILSLVFDGVSAAGILFVVYRLGRLAGALEGLVGRVSALEAWRNGVLKHVGVGE